MPASSQKAELPYSGIFALYNDQLKLVSTDLKGPNGIAFSPAEKYLYVGNWDPEKKIVSAMKSIPTRRCLMEKSSST